MIREEMLTEGLSIAYGVHQRYNGSGRTAPASPLRFPPPFGWTPDQSLDFLLRW